MYSKDQIVFDVTNQVPVNCSLTNERRTTHFIKCKPRPNILDGNMGYEIALPANIEEAKEQLRLGIISPAPLPDTHCPGCFNWKSNCQKYNLCTN